MVKQQRVKLPCARALRETDVAIAAGSFLSREGRLALALLELAGDIGQDAGYGRTVVRQKIGQRRRAFNRRPWHQLRQLGEAIVVLMLWVFVVAVALRA